MGGDGLVSFAAKRRALLAGDARWPSVFQPGINHLNAGWTNEQRADAELAKQVIGQFKSWHFNTAGYGNSPPMLAHTPFVSFLNLVPTSRFLREKASFPDVFDATFQRDLEKRIERQCRDVRENPRLLGYMWTDTPMWNLKDARRNIQKDWVSTCASLPPRLRARSRMWISCWKRTAATSQDRPNL